MLLSHSKYRNQNLHIDPLLLRVRKLIRKFEMLVSQCFRLSSRFMMGYDEVVYKQIRDVLFNLAVFTGARGRGGGTWSARVCFAAFPVAR